MLKILLPLLLLLSGVFALLKLSCSPSALSPEIKGVKDVQIESIDNEHVKLKVTVLAKNKNNFSVNVKDIFVYVLFNSDTIGVASSSASITLPSDAETDINLKTDFITAKLAPLLNDNTDSIKFSLKGKLNAEVAYINVPVDIDVPFTFSLKDNLYKTIENDSQKEKIISIQSASLQNIGLSESTVIIDFLLKNPYGVSCKLKNYPSQIYINGKYSGDGDIVNAISISEKNDSVSGSFLFQLDNFNSASSLLGSLFSRKIEYETRGVLYLEILNYEIKLPYNFKGVLIKL